VLFSRIVETSRALRATRSRREKMAILAGCLGDLAPEEAGIGVSFLAGEPRQERLGVGYATFAGVGAPASEGPPRLTLLDVDEAFEALAAAAGPGSQRRREEVLEGLLRAATADERELLGALIVREVRQGSLEGLLVEAVAAATGADPDAVRRALMMAGDVRPVAAAALARGPAALEDFRLELFRPLRPMLAQPSGGMDEALQGLDRAAVEAKLDGARIQVHRRGERVEVYSRNLRRVTDRVPEIVDRLAALDLDSIVLDGEAIALDPDSRPLPFQVTMGRFGTRDGSGVPLRAFFFDCLHLDGVDLLDRPAGERTAAMARVLPEGLRIDRVETGDPSEAEAFLDGVLAAGHEGVVVKDLGAPYAAGRRGAAWRKVKPAHTLDLVVLAAEWGSGRRRGLLSNLHLGARDPEGGFVMLGKTFKGLTDEMLARQTAQFLELETGREGHVVFVRPEVVVEIAFDGVQSSPRYPGGMALRFARVKGYRPDKDPAEADTVETVREIHRGRRV
jgi:DNA ligase-1